mmetsp:Transcript_6657/g.3757  ORF Transcript_6657/g.3757 Transcript_6657/m.3757 type:complete len:83 (-) Transcript_6657:515-763(-)
METCESQQMSFIIETLVPHIVQACFNPHGTRVIQKLVELLVVPMHKVKIINALKNHVTILAADLNGNHVLQRCLISLKPDEN